MRARSMKRRWWWAVSCTAAALQASCSWAFVDRAPANAATLPYFDCTTSHLAPNLDAVGAGLMALSALGAISDSQSSADTTAGATLVLIGAGLLASAIHGWHATGDCREAKLSLQQRLRWPPPREAAGDPWHRNGADLLPALSSPTAPAPAVAPAASPGAAPPAPASPGGEGKATSPASPAGP